MAIFPFLMNHPILQTIGIVPIVIAIFIYKYLANHIQIIHQGHRALVVSRGKYSRVIDPGLHILSPFESLHRPKWTYTIEDVSGNLKQEKWTSPYISTGEITYDFPPYSFLTKDMISITVNGVVSFKIVDLFKACFSIENLYDVLRINVHSTLRNVFVKYNCAQLMETEEELQAAVRTKLASSEENWGVLVTRFEIQEVIPPQNIVTENEKRITEAFHHERSLASERSNAQLIKLQDDAQAKAAQRKQQMDHAKEEAQSRLTQLRAQTLHDQELMQLKTLRSRATAQAEIKKQETQATEFRYSTLAKYGFDANFQLRERAILAVEKLASNPNIQLTITPSNLASLKDLITSFTTVNRASTSSE